MASGYRFVEPLEQRRLLSAGLLDQHFGTNGIVSLNLPVPDLGRVQDLVTQPDGKYIAWCELLHPHPERPNEILSISEALVRLNRNGTLDTTFGGNGTGAVETDLRADFEGDLLLQPDGMILLATRHTLARFNSDGTPDSAFGSDGQVQMGADSAQLALQPDGKIIVGGARSGILYAQRFHADGTPDNSFSGDSVATLRGAGRGPRVAGVAVMPNGTIYIGGTWAPVPQGETEFGVFAFDIAHLRANGTLDTAYGTSGTGIVEVRQGVEIGWQGRMVVDQASENVFFGIFNFGNLDHRIWRYDRQGRIDTAYGNNGIFSAAAHSTGGISLIVDAQALALQHDGSVIVGGSKMIGTAPGGPGPDQMVTNPALMRVLPNGQPELSFGTNGVGVAQLPGAIPASNERSTTTETITFGLDGSIVVAARDRDGTFALMRFWRDDSPAAELEVRPALITAASSDTLVFLVTYRDDEAIELSTLGNRDLRITGPEGYFRYAKFDRVIRRNIDSSLIAARYKISPPGGSWSPGDNGKYFVRLRGSQVSDRSGNFSEARTIGSFEARLPAARIAPSTLALSLPDEDRPLLWI